MSHIALQKNLKYFLCVSTITFLLCLLFPLPFHLFFRVRFRFKTLNGEVLALLIQGEELLIGCGLGCRQRSAEYRQGQGSAGQGSQREGGAGQGTFQGCTHGGSLSVSKINSQSKRLRNAAATAAHGHAGCATGESNPRVP